MLLEELTRYGQRLEAEGQLAPAMYAKTPIRWEIPLDGEGRQQGAFVPMVGEGRTAARGKALLTPHVQRSSGVRAKLLADNAEYVLGVARDPAKQERVDRCHAAFVETVDACATATEEPSVRAVAAFLDSFDRQTFEPPDGFDAGDLLTFRVGGVRPIDLPAVRRFWAASTAEAGKTAEMECLVCGETKAVEERLPFKLKGIPGGQSSGTALVSANADAFESYGLTASFTSPICRDCGESFAKAANHLLKDPAGHVVVGGNAYVFWTREPVEFSAIDFLRQPDPVQVAALLESAFGGRRGALDGLDEEKFFAAAFSAAGGRVVVRDWIETTVGNVRESLARWFALQKLVDPHQPEEPRYYGLYALAASTVHDPNRDLSAEVPRQLLRFALAGGRRPLPDRLLYETVRRNRAEQGLTRPRAVLIKMVLMSQHNLSNDQLEDQMVELETKNQPPSYHCGRLLAVLENIQSDAIAAKATLIDRFYGSASSAPASVFGFLLRNAQAHLAKLRKEKRGRYVQLDQQLSEVLSHLDTFPTTLPMKEQARFGLGYYHQRAARFAGKGGDAPPAESAQ